MTKISGFTLCRNGVRLGFPFLESIKSLAPLCEEIVVACGAGEDNTREELQKLSQTYPLKIIDTQWDMASVKGGSILASQTNIALDHCKNEIVLYLQGDEVLHEEDYSILKADIERLVAHPQAMSLLLQWVHFFGDTQSVAHSRKWYRREIRVFKKASGLRSYKDAQGFRNFDEVSQKWSALPTLESRARVFHYGWVRPADLMALKTNEFQHWWHGQKGSAEKNNIFRPQYGIRKFEGTHPKVMKEYLAALPKIEKSFYAINRPPLGVESLRSFLTQGIEQCTGWRPGEFKNYSKIL